MRSSFTAACLHLHFYDSIVWDRSVFGWIDGTGFFTCKKCHKQKPLKSYHYRPKGRRTIGRPKKTEKQQECANMGKEKRLELWWHLYRTSLPERDVRNITSMDFCWTECTSADCSSVSQKLNFVYFPLYAMDLICKINFTFLKHTLIYTRTLHIHDTIS